MNFPLSRRDLRAALAAAGAAACLAGPASAFDQAHGAWDRILKAYTSDGLVSYAALKAEPKALESYLDSLGDVTEADYGAWNRDRQIAFWINAYNALTLKVILDHYPIEPSFPATLRYPKNSIRQIPGVWKAFKFLVMKRAMTLDDIEHETLRKRFHEPRVHMALVCAARGCPPLRAEAYAGAKLEEQLDDQARLFLKDPAKFRIDRDAGRVHLSSIFKWFGGDFMEKYAPAEAFGGSHQAESASLSFISRYLDAEDRRYLAAGKYKVAYLDYDWSLNERSRP